MAAKGKETHCVTKLMPKLSFWSQSLEIEILSCGYYGSLETMFNIGPTSRGDYNAVQRQRSLLMFCPALLMMVRICTNQAIFGLPWSFSKSSVYDISALEPLASLHSPIFSLSELSTPRMYVPGLNSEENDSPPTNYTVHTSHPYQGHFLCC